jgi:monoamine oxidase
MNRRSAMTLLPAALLARRARAQTMRRVVLIGAGLAGLSVASVLPAAGHEVLVLEARTRIGGCIRTSRLWPDLPVDLGASWIHGVNGNPITALADQAGVARVPTSYYHGLSLGPEGQRIDLTGAMEAAETLVSAARDAAGQRETDISLADAVRSSPGWQQADAGTRRLTRHFVNGTVEQEYAGVWSETSAWHVDSKEEFGGPEVMFPGGYYQIADHLTGRFTVRMGQTVSALAPTTEGVEVSIAGGPTLAFDHAVVTLPLGVLKSRSVRFARPLHPQRQEAIDSLGMGLLNKCWLRFDRVAWDADVDWIEWLGPRDGHWAQWINLARATGSPVLCAFHAGDQAREIEALDDDATLAAAHEAQKAIFGTGFPAPLAAQITRWSQDPFALGAYSFHATGTSPATRKALGGTDWDGRLIFAGEATSADYPGTAHGAFLSGEAAARTVLERAG